MTSESPKVARIVVRGSRPSSGRSAVTWSAAPSTAITTTEATRAIQKLPVLLDEQDGHAVPLEDVDDLPDLRDHPRHEALGRLVQQDDARLQHHRAGDGEHLLLASR